MGSESKNRNDGGEVAAAAARGIPPTAKKVVQTVKEIVNCTEQEIYAVLKECDMDPNRAVERLLAQDTFHEVRSKRERRKEMKEASDSRTTRGNSLGFSRGGKFAVGSDRRVLQSGLPHATYNEHGKAVGKGEVGSGCAPVTSSAATRVVGKSSKNDSSSTDNGRQSLRTGDSVPDPAQISPGSQPLLIGVNKGHLSMADVVRMGRTCQDSVSHNHDNASGVSASGNSESSLSLHHQNNSEQQVLHGEWPLIEQPTGGTSQAVHISSTSNANGPFVHPNLHTQDSLRRNCEIDGAQVSLRDVASDNVNSEKIESAFISSKQTITSSNTGQGSRTNSNLKNTCTSDFHRSHEHHEVALDFQRLSMRESEMELPSSEDNSALVLPNDFQPWSEECSHLSFGTYNGGSNSASSAHLASNHLSRSDLEENFATIDETIDDSLAQILDDSSVYDGDKQLGFDVFRGTAGDQNYDFLSSSRREHLKNTVREETHVHEYSSIASRSDLSLQNSHWGTPSLPLKHSGLQNGSHAPFSREQHTDSNSIPDDVLAFLISQSQRARYSNAESSVIDPGALALNRSALPQDLMMQSSVHFQQLPDTKNYRSMPQNQSYMATINPQQAALSNNAYIQSSGNTAYIQSPAHMKPSLPQHRNEFHMSRLPPATASDAFGYGNVGSSFYSTGSILSNPSPGYMKPSSNFDEILPSQYNGGRNLSSIQQHGDFSQWDYGAESRSSFLPERSQYNFLGQQPSQASLSQYVSPGYSDLQHSRARVLEELQQQGDFHDLSKQLYQFRQHSH